MDEKILEAGDIFLANLKVYTFIVILCSSFTIIIPLIFYTIYRYRSNRIKACQEAIRKEMKDWKFE